VLTCDLDHPQGVRRVRRADHEDERRITCEHLHSRLPIRRGVTDVGLGRRLDVGESSMERGDDLPRVVHGQRRLRDVRHVVRVGDVEPFDV
jgi:hypothetical protein